MIKKWILTGCFTLVAAFAMAATPIAPSTESCKPAFQQLERDIPSLYLLNGLFLSQEQYEKLGEILQKAQKYSTRHLEALTALAQDSRALRKAFKQDQRMLSKKIRGADVRPQTADERNFHQARQTFNRLNDEYRERIRDLAHDANALLTPAQQATMGSFEPCFIPAEDFKNPVRVGQARNDTRFGENILDRLRKVPDERLGVATDRAVERITDYVMQQGHIAYSEGARANKRSEIEQRLKAMLPPLREMNDVDYELEKATLVNQIIVVPQRSAPDPNDPTGTLTKIRLYLLNPGILDVVEARAKKTTAVLSPGSPYTSYETKDVLREYRDDRQTARILALLDLTRKQAIDILPILEQGIRARQQLESRMEQQMCEAITPYRELRNALAGGAPTRDTESNANHYHHQVKVLQEEDIVSAMAAYEQELDALLTAEQVGALLAGRAPDKRSAHQQAAANMRDERQAAYRLMDKARRMSATLFDREKTDMTIDYLEACLASDKEEEEVDIVDESDRIVALLAEIRSLDGPEFSRRKEDLATDLSPRRAEARNTKYGHKYHQGTPLPELDRSTLLLFTSTGHLLVQELAK
ncbi:MAG: hypothetical protein EOM20_11940 [Spartobacteria bacterium]|nr:hypothetical protein [Spartobacteria bacterium]